MKKQLALALENINRNLWFPLTNVKVYSYRKQEFITITANNALDLYNQVACKDLCVCNNVLPDNSCKTRLAWRCYKSSYDGVVADY